MQVDKDQDVSRLTVGFSREDENAEEWNPLKTPHSPHSEADSVPNQRLGSAGVKPEIRAREQNGYESVLIRKVVKGVELLV